MTDVKTLLQTNFPQIDRVFFEVEVGVNYLRVVTAPASLATTTKLTQDILALFEANHVERAFVLDVYATPPSRELEWDVLSTLTSAKLEVHLATPIQGHASYTGALVSVTDEALVLRYNAKGQMRKIILPRAAITMIATALP